MEKYIVWFEARITSDIATWNWKHFRFSVNAITYRNSIKVENIYEKTLICYNRSSNKFNNLNISQIKNIIENIFIEYESLIELRNVNLYEIILEELNNKNAELSSFDDFWDLDWLELDFDNEDFTSSLQISSKEYEDFKKWEDNFLLLWDWIHDKNWNLTLKLFSPWEIYRTSTKWLLSYTENVDWQHINKIWVIDYQTWLFEEEYFLVKEIRRILYEQSNKENREMILLKDNKLLFVETSIDYENNWFIKLFDEFVLRDDLVDYSQTRLVSSLKWLNRVQYLSNIRLKDWTVLCFDSKDRRIVKLTKDDEEILYFENDYVAAIWKFIMTYCLKNKVTWKTRFSISNTMDLNETYSTSEFNEWAKYKFQKTFYWEENFVLFVSQLKWDWKYQIIEISEDFKEIKKSFYLEERHIGENKKIKEIKSIDIFWDSEEWKVYCIKCICFLNNKKIEDYIKIKEKDIK